MYTALLSVQYASIALMLFMCAYLTKKWSKPVHGWLFFYCVSTLVNNAGYLGVMLSRTESEAVLTLQFSYLGRVWIPFSLLNFVLLLCTETRYPRVTVPLAFFHTAVYASVLFLRKNRLYYRAFSFAENGFFPHITHTNGILHHLNDLVILSYIAVGLFLLFRAIKRNKNPQKRKQLFFITAAIFTDSVFFVFEIFRTLPGYDLPTLGYTLASVFLYISVFKYNLLGTKEIAREVMIDRLSEGIIALDNGGFIQYFNEPAKRIYPSLAIGSDKVPEEVIKVVKQGAHEHIEIGERIYALEETDLTRSGESFGKLYALIDETEHFRYMDALKEQRAIADRANEAKSAFLASMSHEIRTPINAVLGLDEMILRETGEEHIRAYAHDIQSSGKSLLSIVNDILDLSKIEAGKMEIIPCDYDLRALLNDLCTMTETRAKSKSLDFIVRVDESTPCLLFGDDTRIKQCVLNLLTNAVKYTPSGSVTLAVGYERTGVDEIQLRFTVADTGIGIKAEDLEKLSKPFERIEEKRNKSIEGTGLGMSIVNGLLAKMNAPLSVKSEYGKGSEFSFAVTQTVRDWKKIGTREEALRELRADTAHYREQFQAPDAHILVVDDTPMNLTVFCGLLKQTQIQIDTAPSAEEGLKKAGGHGYDLIFIDHLMPKMDGIEMLAALRADSESLNRETPCIALTANALGGAREMYLAAGFADYLSKPIDSARLEAMIAEMLPKEKVLYAGDDGYASKPPFPCSNAGIANAAEVSFPRLTREWHLAETDYRVKGDNDTTQGTNNTDKTASDPLFAEIFGLDSTAALKHCGSADTFRKAVCNFYEAIEEKANLIEEYAASSDWKNYTIFVHALKSSARLIGATELSEVAKDLEAKGNEAQTGREEAIAIIRERTPALLADYRAYTSKLAPLCEESVSADSTTATASTKPPLSPEKLRDALSAIVEVVSAFDFDTADTIIKEIDNYEIPSDFQEKYTEIKKAVRNVDTVAVRELLGR